MRVAIAKVAARPYALAFERPVVSAHGRFTHRRGWLLGVTDSDGRTGWGDAAPWPGFGSSDERVSLEIGGLTDGQLASMPVDGVNEIASDVARKKLAPEVAHALELALLDLLAQRRGVPLAGLLAEGAFNTAATHTLVVATPAPGSRWLKVKVGAKETLDELEARLGAIVASAHPEAAIRLDAGGGWTPERAAEAIARLCHYRVHTVEQPLAIGRIAELASLREIANAHGVRVAADEDVTGTATLDALLAAGAVDEVVLKPMFVGGLLSARRLARRALSRGCSATVTNALGSAIGRAGARHLAAILEGVHGLSDALAEDVAELPRRCENRVALPPGSGLGVWPREREEDARAKAQIPHPLESSALARPNHPALAGDASVTYRELADMAAARAHDLTARGVTPGARVGLSGPHDARWVAWLHAVGWMDAVAIPLPHGGPGQERERVLRATHPDIVIDTTVDVAARATPARAWSLHGERLVICSSGTTGAPRPVGLTTLQLTASAFGSAIRLGHDTGDRWLCCLPLEHVGGLSILFRCAFYGTTVVLHDRFDAERVSEAIDAGETSLVSLVPAMLARVLDARDDRPFPSTLRVILLGGACAPEALLSRCRAISAPVALTWGMTESASQVATSFPGSERIVPHAFARVGTRDGRLTVSGPVVRSEIVSSDAGNVGSDGAVDVAGRADDVIISGGEKVAPAEIEQVLRRHPAIDDAAVVARASAEWGRRPYAVVQSDSTLTPETLRAWCREHLAPFKVPDGFLCLPALPRAALGKVALSEVRSLIDARFPEKGTQP